MGWNGAGGYTRARNFSADASAGIKILASAVDQEFNDFASAMTLARARDGQNTPTADLPMGGFRHTGVGQAASATNYIRARDVITNVPIYMEDAATSTDNVSVSASFFATASANTPPPNGTRILVRMLSDKSSVTGLHLNTGDGSPHSANIKLQTGSELYVGALVSGGIYDLHYVSAASVWQVVNPTSRYATTAAPGVMEIATTAEAAAGTDTLRAITPATLITTLLSANAATTASAGVIEIATTAEASGGTDASRAVTPAAMRAVHASTSAVFAASINNALPYLVSFVVSGSGTKLLANTKASTWVLASGGSAGVWRVTHNLGLASTQNLMICMEINAGSAPTGRILHNLTSAGASAFWFRAYDLSGSAASNFAVMITAHEIP